MDEAFRYRKSASSGECELIARRVLLPLVRCAYLRARIGGLTMSTLALKSSAFHHLGSMDKRFTCQGADVSPPLEWTGVPPGTKSFALVVDDPDAPDPAAPKLVWVHWVLFDIPPSVKELAEGASSRLPSSIRVGKNDWGNAAYGGPCPPIGRHRYFHKLYALDTTFGLSEPTKAELERAMQGHILAQAELVGTYQKEQ